MINILKTNNKLKTTNEKFKKSHSLTGYKSLKTKREKESERKENVFFNFYFLDECDKHSHSNKRTNAKSALHIVIKSFNTSSKLCPKFDRPPWFEGQSEALLSQRSQVRSPAQP